MQTSSASTTWDPPQPLPPPAVPPHPAPRRRWPMWTAIGVGAAVVGLAIAGLVAVDRTALRHDLITAHFDGSADPFQTGTMPAYTATLQDGTYAMTATSDPDSRAMSFAMFTRTAYAVVLEADVVSLQDVSGDAIVGVACFDLPETNGHGYAFATDDTGASLVRLDTEGTVLTTITTVTLASAVGHRLGITCTKDGDDALVTGTVDGVEMIATVDHSGFTRYQAGAMLFLPYDQGDEVRFDEFIARVPGE